MADIGAFGNLTVYQVLAKTVAQFPDREFMVYQEQRPTYRQLHDKVQRVAKSLLALGIKRGDNVALWMGNCPDWVDIWFGCASIGAAIVPLNTRYRSHEVDYILAQSEAVALFLKDHFLNIDYIPIVSQVAPDLASGNATNLNLASHPNLRHVVVLGSSYPGMLDYDQFLRDGEPVADARLEEARAQVRPSDMLNLMYTSGTTGFPKGAMLTHAMALRTYGTKARLDEVTEHDRLMCGALPFFHCFGAFQNVLTATINGACVIAMDAFEPREWLTLWQKEQCTFINGVPTMYVTALDQPDFDKFDLSSARAGICGATFVPADLVRTIVAKMGFKPGTGYGLTEATGMGTQCTIDDDPEDIASTIGRPILGWEVKIANPDSGEALPPNAQGEIWIRGYNVMLGYYKKPEETAQTITPDGWLRTGDLGTCDERGYFRITGRLKDMFIVGGYNAYPAEIENLLFSHPKIKQAYVVGVPDYRMGEVGAAFVELKEGQTTTAEELIAFCKGQLANFKVPRYVLFSNGDWPMTASGKVQKFLLRDRAIKELGLQELVGSTLVDGERK